MSSVEISALEDRQAAASELIPSQRFYMAMIGSGCANITLSLRLSGRLNIEALRRSLAELIDRHESFRTRMICVDVGRHHRVSTEAQFSMKVVDFSELPWHASERENLARAYIAKFSERNSDLTVDTLFDVQLLKLSEDIFVLVVSAHHLITDGISLVIMFRELWQLYRAFARGEPSPLTHVPFQFSNYRRWQSGARRMWLEKHASYWKEHLAGAAPVRLPRSTPPSRQAEYVAATLAFSLKPELTAALLEIAARSKMFLSLVVYAIYALTIFRVCGQSDFIVTTTVNGRDRPEHQDTTGYLAHPIYLRILVRPEDTFSKLLADVRDEYLRTILRKDCGDTVVERLDLMNRTLVQWHPWSQDELEGLPAPQLAAGLGLEVERFAVPLQIRMPEGLDFYLVLREAPDGIAGHIMYRTATLATETVLQMVATFKYAAEQLAADVNASLGKCLSWFPLSR